MPAMNAWSRSRSSSPSRLAIRARQNVQIVSSGFVPVALFVPSGNWLCVLDLGSKILPMRVESWYQYLIGQSKIGSRSAGSAEPPG